MREFHAAFPFILGIVFQVGLAVGTSVVVSRSNLDPSRNEDLQFLRLCDAAQAFAGFAAAVFAGYDVEPLPGLVQAAISVVVFVSALACMRFIWSRSDNRYDELKCIGLSWLNQVLIGTNLALGLLAIAVTMHHDKVF